MDAVNYVVAHWETLTGLGLGLLVLFNIIKNREWDRLLVTAAEITEDVGELVGADNQEKRHAAADMLYESAGPVARRIFTREQMASIVDIAWHTITKPAMKDAAHDPA